MVNQKDSGEVRQADRSRAPENQSSRDANARAAVHAQSSSLRQVGDVESQRCGDPIQNKDAGIAFPSFDTAQVGLVHLGQMGELLLGDAPCAPCFLDVEPHPDADIHPRMSGGGSPSGHRL